MSVSARCTFQGRRQEPRNLGSQRPDNLGSRPSFWLSGPEQGISQESKVVKGARRRKMLNELYKWKVFPELKCMANSDAAFDGRYLKMRKASRLVSKLLSKQRQGGVVGVLSQSQMRTSNLDMETLGLNSI